MEKVWNAQLEVNLKNFEYNYNQIKNCVEKNVDIMPVFKDNAYGSYLNHNIEFLKKIGIRIIGVAIVDEGIELRKLGFDGEILVLNQPLVNELSYVHEYNLTIGVGSIDFLNDIIQLNCEIKMHIEVETGMGRTGVFLDKLQEFIDKSKACKNIKITGIYTHFSCSDSDEKYTKNQIKLFNLAIEKANRYFDLKYIHCCNSAGIVNYPEAHFNLVRPGLILLGYHPDISLKSKINLKPVIKLKSKISFLKEVKANTFISYNKTFCTKDTSKIATIPLGYADGIRRCLSNKGHVVINGQLAPIVGKICMDCFMADVTNITCHVNDDVYIWDNENIYVDDIANLYDTINYEVICTISKRVPRKFII